MVVEGVLGGWGGGPVWHVGGPRRPARDPVRMGQDGQVLCASVRPTHQPPVSSRLCCAPLPFSVLRVPTVGSLVVVGCAPPPPPLPLPAVSRARAPLRVAPPF
ncbi:hypothetical protein I4F81_000649 [Pyropia yezoensis]|uniref:Uncharacterized protein n=1 Tax=Pyropia yezoensis TaxID=2788 RepID=A0ACC3BJV4_PYRYE|nr:hypothetical protein I4F81_000649 [Neopyropia yezoensis]